MFFRPLGSIYYPDLCEATDPNKIYDTTHEPRLQALPRRALEYEFDSLSRSKRHSKGWLSKLTQLKWVSNHDLQIPGDIPPYLVRLKFNCLVACRGAVRSYMIILEFNFFLICVTMQLLFRVFCSCWETTIYRYAVFTQNTQTDHTNSLSSVLVPMTGSSPTSPLSLDNSPNGSPDHHDQVPSAAALLILPNLESYLCGMEFDLTIIANLIQPDPVPMSMPSNTVWGVMVILKSPHLNQNFVLNFQEVLLQGSFL